MKSLTHWPFCLFHAGFTQMAIALQKLFCFLDPKPVRFRALDYFQEGKLLRSMRWEGEQEYPVYVINRTKDVERMSRFDASCRKWGINYERVEAINCADPKFDFIPYEAEIGKAFYGKTNFLRGAVGCFLSHVKAWRKIIEANISGAIICEDDAQFLGPIPHNLSNYDMPPDADLIFLNQRTATGISYSVKNQIQDSSDFKYYPIYDAIFSVLDIFSKIPAIGTDGYFVTRRGVKKILTIYDALHIYMEVDWFLFFHSLSQSERIVFLNKDATGRFDMLDFASEKLNSYVLLPSFVEQRSMGSIISFDKPENYIERAAMFEHLDMKG